MKNVLRIGIVSALAFAPFAVFAVGSGQQVGNILDTFGGLISKATPIVVALALLGFFWGLAIYIFNAGDEKKKSQGKNIMIYGVLALFIMLSIFGIIGVLQSTFGVQNANSPQIPFIQQTNSNGSNSLYGQ